MGYFCSQPRRHLHHLSLPNLCVKSDRLLAIVSGLAMSASAYAGVTLSIDSVTTQASTTWSGSPAGTLGQSIDTPNLENSFDGGVSSAIVFKAGSSFTLGAIEIDQAGMTAGNGIFNLFMYDLGSSYTVPADYNPPVYAFTGSEVDLLSAGMNVTLANASQFDVFTFDGADNVSMNSGDSYLFDLVAADGLSNLSWHRGPKTANQTIAVNSVVVGGAGTVLNFAGTAASRTPIAAFFAEPVPEPSSLALLGLGALAGLGFIRRKNS